MTTDFGARDWFVGTMKGVVARIAPKTRVIDLTHEVAAGDIRAGAFALAASFGFFPKGTVHVVVVDPGVGSDRKALAVQTTNHYFVGPDNGVLSFALRQERITAIRSLENEAYFLPAVSHTFHGRDIFAPVAAHLSQGVPVRKFGPKLKDLVRLDWPGPRVGRKGIEGEVVYIDHFGNCVTSIDAAAVQSLGTGPLEAFLRPRNPCPVGPLYQSARPGKAVAVVGSSGFLEIAVNGGNAARQLGLRIGSVVKLGRR